VKSGRRVHVPTLYIITAWPRSEKTAAEQFNDRLTLGGGAGDDSPVSTIDTRTLSRFLSPSGQIQPFAKPIGNKP
jgi:hypothetical protein